MKESDAQAALLTPIILGKDEMNLAEYPLSILTHRVPRNRKTYSFTQRITDHQGTIIKQSWSVLGSDKYGLPTPYDDDVLIALIYYSLALPISKRLFRYLDKNRYKKNRYEEAVMRMASKLPLTYAYPSQVKQKLARAHEELLRHGYLANVTYDVTREGEDKVIYDFADGGAKMDGHPIADAKAAGQLVLDFYAQLTGTHDLAYDPVPKEVALAQDYLTTYGSERSAFVVRHALDAAKAVDFPIQTFGGTKNFLPQALAAWEGHAGVEGAKREADARADAQRRRERETRDRQRRLADRRAALADEALAAVRRRAGGA